MEHPSEIDDAASPVVGTAGNGILSRCFHGAGEIERKLLAVLRKSNPLTRAKKTRWRSIHPLRGPGRRSASFRAGLTGVALQQRAAPSAMA